MTSLTLKNLPKELHEKLKARARSHRRSLNAEAIACLEAAVAPTKVDVDALLEAARTLRAEVKGRLDDSGLRTLREAGRR